MKSRLLAVADAKRNVAYLEALADEASTCRSAAHLLSSAALESGGSSNLPSTGLDRSTSTRFQPKRRRYNPHRITSTPRIICHTATFGCACACTWPLYSRTQARALSCKYTPG
ncbi:g2668 [Coccomyxa elongata]